MYTGQPTLCLRTSDLDQAIRFYSAIGLSHHKNEGASGQSAIMRRGNFQIMLMNNFGRDSITFRGADIAAIAEHLSAEELEVSGAPTDDGAGGTAWLISDPDGHGIFFNTQPQDITAAARRKAIARVIENTKRDLTDLGADQALLEAFDNLRGSYDG